MSLNQRPGPYQELTKEENRDILGTWTSPAWRGFAVERVAAKWWRLRDATLAMKELPPWHPSRPWDAEKVGFKHLMEMKSPLADLIDEGRRTAGAINGEHRRDLKEAIIGAPQQSVQLAGAPMPLEKPPEKPAARKGW